MGPLSARKESPDSRVLTGVLPRKYANAYFASDKKIAELHLLPLVAGQEFTSVALGSTSTLSL
jgi:hypothetical protein